MDEEETKEIIDWFAKHPKYRDAKVIEGYIKGYTGKEATENDINVILRGLD